MTFLRHKDMFWQVVVSFILKVIATGSRCSAFKKDMVLRKPDFFVCLHTRLLIVWSLCYQ